MTVRIVPMIPNRRPEPTLALQAGAAAALLAVNLAAVLALYWRLA